MSTSKVVCCQGIANFKQSLLHMGNCNQNFENIQDDGEPFQNTSLAASPQIGIEHQLLKPDNANPNYPLAHVIDEQAIQPTLARHVESPVKVSEKSKSETPVLFPQASSLPDQSSQPTILQPLQAVKKTRPKLQELDLTFYHKLALPDYEYRPLPESDRQLFSNVETYEMKDNYGVKYLGQWLNNTIHGNGVLLSNTAKYIGQFKYGLKHYHGRQILKNEVYQGMFEGGRRKGEGTRYTESSTEIGYFDDQLVNGKIIYIDGREETKTKYLEIEASEVPVNYVYQEEQMGKKDENAEGQLYSEKYYQQSQLPPEWEDFGNPSSQQSNKLRF